MKRTIRYFAAIAALFLTGCNVPKRIIDGVIGAWCLAFCGGCLCIVAMTGCTITTRNAGEVGFSYATELKFFHRAAQTAPEPATINTDAPALIDWLVKPKEPTEPPNTPGTVSPTP